MNQVEVETMENSDSKLVFKKGISKPSEPESTPTDDPCRRGFRKLAESTEIIFSLFSPVDVRRAQDSSLPNIETLLLAIKSRLFTLRHYRLFPDIEVAPEKHALNCIRVLTRILPYLYDADYLEV